MTTATGPSALTESVQRALSAVRDPASGQDILSAGLVEGLTVRDGLVQFALAVPRERAASLEPLRRAAEQAAAAVPGVLSATVVLTAHRPAQAAPAPAPSRWRVRSPSIGSTLITSAPKSASTMPQVGPITMWVNSTTRNPVRGRAGSRLSAVVMPRLCNGAAHGRVGQLPSFLSRIIEFFCS